MKTRPVWILPVIILSQFTGTSLWFAGNAIIADIQCQWSLGDSALGLGSESGGVAGPSDPDHDQVVAENGEGVQHALEPGRLLGGGGEPHLAAHGAAADARLASHGQSAGGRK